MKFKVMTTMFALTLALAAGFVTHSLTTGAASVLAFDAPAGPLHVVKDCNTFTGSPGSYCAIVSSNLEQIPAGSQIYYDQPSGGPPIGAMGFLDSNILLYVGPGDWAVARCTLDNNNNRGVCTLSYGTGPLAGVTARVNVTYQPGGDGALYDWDGSYSFNRDRD
jgi:hypothetical protein